MDKWFEDADTEREWEIENEMRKDVTLVRKEAERRVAERTNGE